MVTMTIPPNIQENIVLDYSYCGDNKSIEYPFIENTTNTTNLDNSKITIDILNILGKKYTYDIGSMNTNSIGEDMQKIYYYTKERIEFIEKIYEFNSKFIYSIKKEDDVYVAENEFFGIFGYGDTIAEAEKELYQSVDDLWAVYVEEKDENLDEGALVLKKKIIDNIRKIQ